MNTALNRRHFLRLAALTPLAAATPSHALTAIPRTGGASFRPGLNAYSFLYQLNANLRWEGGEYSRQHAAETVLSPEELQKNFNDAIKKSLEQEKAGQQRK